MTRYVIAALLLLLVLFGAGYQLRTWLWADERPPAAAAHATLPAVAAAAPVIELTSVKGRVEVRDTPSSAWRVAGQKMKLESDDALRTDEGSSAELSIGSSVQVELSERSEFTLSEITRELSNVRLESGRVAARLSPDGKSTVRFEVRGNDAVAEAHDGAFSVLRADDGQVTVAAIHGNVSVATKRQKVELSAGLQSVVPALGEPTQPLRIPPSLFLKLAQSARQQLNRRETAITGSTTPGAVVLVNGVPAATGQGGEFTTRVPLEEGLNTLHIKATDALGRSEEKIVAVDVDTKAPKLGSKVVW
ncbi:MAG TPA: FecR domain-containing protein [Polyangiales bacterium]|nr:FecR domain-containing protein [Polyangiales bacterium]